MKGTIHTMRNMTSRLIRFLTFALSLLLLLAAAVVPIMALEPYGNNVRIRNWVSNDPDYSFSDEYKTSVWYQNFTELELTANHRNNVLRIALSQLGYHEGNSAKDFDGMNKSGNQNYIEYARLVVPHYNDNHYEWCACFVNWCLSQAHVDYAYGEIGCWKWVEWLKQNQMFEDSFAYGGSYVPQPADMIFFNWNKVNTGSGHIGYVLYVTDTTIYTVEGNSKDEVGIRSYAIDDPCVIGFGTPDYEAKSGKDAEPTIDFSQQNGMVKGRYILTTDRVRLFSEAENKGSILGRLQLGSTVVLLDAEGDTAHVLADGKDGWVENSALQLLTPFHTATFLANGETVSCIPFEKGALCGDAPDVPQKRGYTGAWAAYTLGTADLTIEAVYTAIPYTVTFMADGAVVAKVTYTVEDEGVSLPEIPAKEGFIGEWPSLTLPLEDVVVEAIYTAITESEVPVESGSSTLPIGAADDSAAVDSDASDAKGCISTVSLLPALVLAGVCLPAMIVPILRKKKY